MLLLMVTLLKRMTNIICFIRLKEKGIKVAISDKLTSGYFAPEGNVDQTDQAVEGSSIFKPINSETYIVR
jgi:hypothetical protein